MTVIPLIAGTICAAYSVGTVGALERARIDERPGSLAARAQGLSDRLYYATNSSSPAIERLVCHTASLAVRSVADVAAVLRYVFPTTAHEVKEEVDKISHEITLLKQEIAELSKENRAFQAEVEILTSQVEQLHALEEQKAKLPVDLRKLTDLLAQDLVVPVLSLPELRTVHAFLQKKVAEFLSLPPDTQATILTVEKAIHEVTKEITADLAEYSALSAHAEALDQEGEDLEREIQAAQLATLEQLPKQRGASHDDCRIAITT